MTHGPAKQIMSVLVKKIMFINHTAYMPFGF